MKTRQVKAKDTRFFSTALKFCTVILFWHISYAVAKPEIKCGQAMKLAAAKEAGALNKLAKNGDACAQHFLADIYVRGEGQAKADPERALELEKQAAQSGLDIAQYGLALMYLGGGGIESNYKEAVSWLTLAANQGDVPAQTTLGELLIEGRLAEQDIHQGIKWLLRADENGGQVAKQLLETMANSLKKAR